MNAKVVSISRRNEPVIPELLETTVKNDKNLQEAFRTFTPGKQREFADLISEAKQEKTKLARREKIIPMIKHNIGLNDKYRKC